MSNYIVTTDFASKDSLPSGNPLKVAKGADVALELNNIATAIATKEDLANKGIANGYAPLNGSALITKTFQWSTTAYTDVAQTWTQAQTFSVQTVHNAGILTQGASTAGINWKVTSGGTDSKNWDSYADSTTLHFRAVNDALNAANDWATVARSGTAITSVTFAGTINGNGSGLTSLNASNLASGTVPDARVALSTVSQYAASIKCRNHPSKGGTNVTLQSGGSPTGGSDGDIFFIY
jgi:hypothetical protein